MQDTAKEKKDTASIHKIMSEGLPMVDRKIKNADSIHKIEGHGWHS